MRLLPGAPGALCPPCAANNVICRRSRPSETPRKAPQKKNQIPNKHRNSRHSIDATPVSNSSLVEVSVSPPSPTANLAWTSHKIDSILGFIARINAFCTGQSLSLPNSTPPGSEPSLDEVSAFPSNVLHETQSADCDLSPSQTKQLMRLFWSRLRPLMPIVEWDDLKLFSKPTPLQDAITAFSLQYIYHTGLHTRIVGLDWPQFQRQQSNVGMPYFQRCLTAVTQLSTFAGPSITVMQCYCYLTLYLLDSGHHQAAYNMVGLTLRISQSLNYLDARYRGQQVCLHFRRIWWTLIHLDFRCSRHVGKPVTIDIDDLMSLRPNREPHDMHLSNGLLYHTESIRLTAAALAVNEAMGHLSLLDGAVGPIQIEARANKLPDSLYHLQQWRDELPQELCFADIQLEVPDLPPDTEEMPGGEDQLIEQSSTVTLLSTLLLLQYHNIIISLHRMFIQFPTYPLIPKSHPKADTHAATALNHAMTMIRAAHHRMGITDILHGLSELYQYQWNAVITIIGFMLAYPYCHRCSRAREHLDLALEIFDSAGSGNNTASRAAIQTRHLCKKVDTLVQILNPSQPTPPLTTEGHVSENRISDFAWSIGQNTGSALPDMSVEEFWPLADLINLDSWPSYCDEVSGTFMDPVEFAAPYGS
ncbi:hypothetical protein BJX70DRAFT_378729 [Aspergillus crustosus]